MRFHVRRTSRTYSDGGGSAPCEGAFPLRVPTYDRRSFRTPEEHDERFPKQPWLSKGSEHSVNYDGQGRPIGIQRRLEDQMIWCLDVASLDDLVALSKETGESIIIADESYDSDMPYLEIYDDYRE